MKEYPDVSDELSLLDPFHNVRHIPYVPIGKLRYLNSHILRRTEAFSHIGFTDNDATDREEAIRAHLEKYGINILEEQPVNTPKIIDDEVLDASDELVDDADEGEEDEDGVVAAEDSDEVRVPLMFMLGGNQAQEAQDDSVLNHEQNELRKVLVRKANRDRVADSSLFPVEVNLNIPNNIFSDDFREKLELTSDHLHSSVFSSYNSEIPTAWLVYHRDQLQQIRDDVDRFLLTYCAAAHGSLSHLRQEILKSGKIICADHLTSFASPKNIQVTSFPESKNNPFINRELVFTFECSWNTCNIFISSIALLPRRWLRLSIN